MISGLNVVRLSSGASPTSVTITTLLSLVPRVTVSDREFFYLDDDFVDPWVPHDTLVLQPWLFGSHKDLKRYVPVLGRHFRVLRIDRFGLGESERPPFGHRFLLDEIVSDLVGCLDALGVDRVHYFGESFGGVLGVAFATSHPDRLRSLVLSNTPRAINEPTQLLMSPGDFSDPAEAVWTMGPWAYSHERLLGLSGGPAPPAHPMHVWRAEDSSRVPAHVQAGLMKMAFDPSFDISELLARLTVPTLLISPSDSFVTPIEEQAEMFARIPGCVQEIVGWTGSQWDDLEEPATRALGFLLANAGKAA
jgi:pimeloyl-ACP methyl ester carboxylesterase